MEGKDVINVEILINGHRQYKASAALCTKILSAVSYLVIRLLFVAHPEEVWKLRVVAAHTNSVTIL
jgi:hypothetical protein